MAKSNPDCRCVTPKAILTSSEALFTPKQYKNKGEFKFSAGFILPADVDLSVLKAAMKESLTDKFGGTKPPVMTDGKTKGKPKAFTNPIKPSRSEEDDGGLYLFAWSKSQPGIVTGRERAPLTDPKKIYAGCTVIASLTAFAWELEEEYGVSFFLNNLWKIRDSKSGGSHNAAGDFMDTEVDEDAFGSADADVDDDGMFGSVDDEAPF